MTTYDIPLSTVYEPNGGKRLHVQDGRVSLIDRTGDTPFDVVSLRDSDIDG